MSARWAPSVLVPAAASAWRRAPSSCRSQVSTASAGSRSSRSATGSASTMRARGNAPLARGAALRRAPKLRRAAERATAWRATASSRPASQAGSGAAPRSRAACSTRRRSASAASCAVASRAWPGSSAQTSRSRKRRRPVALSWNSVSICGVSQIAARRAAISAWLRGSAPSRRKTRRSALPGRVPVPISVVTPPEVSRPATAHCPAPPRRAKSAIRPRPNPRPGPSREMASRRLVFPEPLGPVSTVMRAPGRQVSAG